MYNLRRAGDAAVSVLEMKEWAGTLQELKDLFTLVHVDESRMDEETLCFEYFKGWLEAVHSKCHD